MYIKRRTAGVTPAVLGLLGFVGRPSLGLACLAVQARLMLALLSLFDTGRLDIGSLGELSSLGAGLSRHRMVRETCSSTMHTDNVVLD